MEVTPRVAQREGVYCSREAFRLSLGKNHDGQVKIKLGGRPNSGKEKTLSAKTKKTLLSASRGGTEPISGL